MTSEQFDEALKTVEGLFRTGYKTHELSRIEAFVRKRVNWDYSRSCLLTLAFVPAAFVLTVLYNEANRVPIRDCSSTFWWIIGIVLGFNLLLVPRLWHLLSSWRVARKSLY